MNNVKCGCGVDYKFSFPLSFLSLLIYSSSDSPSLEKPVSVATAGIWRWMAEFAELLLPLPLAPVEVATLVAVGLAASS